MLKRLFKINLLTGNAPPATIRCMSNAYRTHYCDEISSEDIGKKVQICGWLQSVRFDKFLLIRDSSETIQVFIPENLSEKFQIKDLTLESVVKIEGTVKQRPTGQENQKLKNGSIEIECENFELINKCKPKLPFQLNNFTESNESIRLKYRYLDLRNSELQRNIKQRAHVVAAARNFLNQNGFLDIETPTLFRRTPGGAREFIVPTRAEKKFYCLTQSPQQFKQLLMVGGFNRYYQIARCYRDEELKADRQPEFTQVDLEMSFATENDVMKIIEGLLVSCWPGEKLKIPFRTMTYADAMRFYGIDKPDLRFDMKFTCLNSIFGSANTGISKIDAIGASIRAYAFKVPSEYCVVPEILNVKNIEKEFKSLVKDSKFAKMTLQLMVLGGNKGQQSGLAKYLNEGLRKEIMDLVSVRGDETIVVLFSNDEDDLLECFGKFRLQLADFIDRENLKNKGDKEVKLLRDPNKLEFEWVVDFPLFTFNKDTKMFESTHHPFTAPKPSHLHLVKEMKDLDKVVGQHYDLVLNGNEIAGGSIRIHDGALQRHVLTNILKEDTSPLEHLIEALEFGAPPHGGIAIGLDRLMAIICKTSNIRDVIAFPKTSFGRDIMSDAPSQLPQSELDYYRIQFIPDKK